jgi:two-component system sensor histidine kinase KdpD
VSRRFVDSVALVAGFTALAGSTAAFRLWLGVSNPTIVALVFLLVVLVVAAIARLWVAVVVSTAAMLAFNYFFLPPIGTWTIADPQNWVALFTFLAVSLVASNLSASARARAQEAHHRRDELSRLFDLSRDVLVMTDAQALTALARSMAARFGLDFVAIALPYGDDWQRFEAGPRHFSIDASVLSRVFAEASGTVEFDARARTYSGHALHAADGANVRIAPLRLGVKPIGLLAAAGPIDPGTLDVLAGIAALAIERTRFLEERKSADLTRQREELKTTLLASLGHDLRTPLTAIRVAAANLGGDWLSQTDRIEQADVILAEAERLTRLFQNILDMARIDAGPLAAAVTLAPPADIIAAAREQVEQALRHHRVAVTLESDEPVRLDPRLTAAALAQLLENAAQYSPPGSQIRVAARRVGQEWRVTVTDAGPGIAPEDRPRLFDRFFRGAAAQGRPSGLGMGLSIARGLLAAEGGRVWAENPPEGGAAFTIAVPAEPSPESAADTR